MKESSGIGITAHITVVKTPQSQEESTHKKLRVVVRGNANRNHAQCQSQPAYDFEIHARV